VLPYVRSVGSLLFGFFDESLSRAQAGAGINYPFLTQKERGTNLGYGGTDGVRQKFTKKER
jgi:hypothetical protein